MIFKLELEWCNYYISYLSPDNTYKKASQRINKETEETGQYYVVESLFKEVNYLTGQGGAININEYVAETLVESCSFFKCKSKTSGGAINILARNIMMDKICSFGCEVSEGFAAFSYSYLSTTQRQ